MSGVFKFAASPVGAKAIMAATGSLLLAFVLGHMAGNLQVFLGREAINAYGAMLHERMWLLWLVRFGLLAVVLLHITSASLLTLKNRAVRPVPYAKNTPVKASLASRNMYVSGGMVAFFVIYHLLHFTIRATDPSYQALADDAGRFDVYTMVVLGFSNVWVSLSYACAMILLGAHLWHGASSMFQSLGLVHPRYRPLFDNLGPVIACVIVLGNLSIPIAVLSGLVRL